MIRSLFVCAAAALAVGFSSVASAATVTANYSFVPSAPGSVAAPNTSHWENLSITPITNMAPITGSASITFDTAGGTPVDGGTATLDSLSFVVGMGAAGYGGAELGLGGSFTATLVSPVSTTWTGGTLAPVTTTLHLGGTVTCDTTSGSPCDLLDVFPAMLTLNMDTTVSLGGMADLSHFAATLPLTFDPQALQGNAVLAAVPEPGTLLLFGAGLAGLVAAGRWRQR